MLNVSEVFTSKWVTLDKIRNLVEKTMTEIGGFTPADISKVRNALDTSKIKEIEPSTPFVDFQSNNGLVIPDTPTCLEISERLYKDALGEDIDTTTESHVGRMIEQTGKIISSAIGITAMNIMQSDINSATGAYLDAIGSWFFVNRDMGAKTRLQVSLSLKGQIEEPIALDETNATITDGNEVVYKLKSKTIFSNDNPVQICVFEASEVGEIIYNSIGANFSDKIKNSFDVGSVSAKEGYEVESDDSYRERIKLSRAKSVSFLESIASALRDDDGVFDCMVCENTTNEQSVTNDIVMPPHSIAAIVSYDGASETARRIATSLYKHKSCGAAYTNIKKEYSGRKPEMEVDPLLDKTTPVEVVVEDEYFGTEYKVTFNAPAVISFGVEVTVAKNKYSGSALEDEVKAAIVSWANGDIPFQEGLGLGQDVKAYEIGAAVSTKIHDIQIDEVKLYAYTEQEGGEEPVKSEAKMRIEIPSFAIGSLNLSDVHVVVA